MPLSVQLNWSDEDMDSNIAFLTSSCSYGIAFGSILSGQLIGHGKRKIVIAF